MHSNNAIARICVLLILLLISNSGRSQFLFKEKCDSCYFNGGFCLDCGDPKASPSIDINNYIITNISEKEKRKVYGTIVFQILIDSTGKQCVLSIDNKINLKSLKEKLKKLINEMPRWNPAIGKVKGENSSRSLIVTFRNDSIITGYLNYDFSNDKKMGFVGEVKIKNKNYHYSKDHLVDHIEVFNRQNSLIPWNVSTAICVDSNDNIWHCTFNGIVKIDTYGKMEVFNDSNSILETTGSKRVAIISCAVDTRNNKWFVQPNCVYKYDNSNNWTKYDTTNCPIRGCHEVYTDHFENVWFITDKGLVKYDGVNWSVINNKNSKLLSSKISGVFVDSKKRIWIGCYSGNNLTIDGNSWVGSHKANIIKIDGDSTEDYQLSETPLKDAVISKGYEDKKGNLYFIFHTFDTTKYSGIAMYSVDGKWTTFNIDNSGIPSNTVLDLNYDEGKKILWVSSNGVGLSYYDNDKWHILTPDNSDMPSVYIKNITLDKKGNLWCATLAGLAKITFKK